MDQTTFVINVLDDSNQRSIEYENRFWLRQNVQEMNIQVCVEDCQVTIEELCERYGKEDAFLVQNGEKIESTYNFRCDKEALLLLRGNDKYFVFLYYPKE